MALPHVPLPLFVLLSITPFIQGVCPGVTLPSTRPKYCKKSCTTDDDCRRTKRCVCDGECGLSCINTALTCPDLMDIPHGHVHWGGNGVFGSNAEYSCEDGYVLIGHSQRRCQGNKEWSGSQPTCRVQLKCGPPPDIAFAVHDGTSYSGEYEVESQVTYSCVPGYHRFNTKGGLAVSKCLLNRKNVAQWFGPELKCKARSCSDPGRLENGKREGDVFEYPYSVQFTCNPGFLLIGSAIRQCESIGEWTGDAPSCRPTECPRPSDPLHGRVLGSSLTYESQVSYSCDPGFRLVGQKQRICLAEGVWAGREPSCEEIRCSPLPPLVNGYIEGSDTHFGSRVVFRCLESMSHSGPDEAICGENGEWSVKPPICLAACMIPSIENGQCMHESSYMSPGRLVPSGTKITVTCQPRHEPNPSAPMECRNSSWNHIPLCSPLNCLDWPPRVPQSRVLFTKSSHGSIARYTCNSGFHLNSEKDTIKCLYGEWTAEGPPLQCVETSCNHPSETFGELAGGMIMLEGQMGAYDFAQYIERVEEGRSIVFQCNKGNYLIGAPKASCVNGQWMPQIKPMCVSQTHPLIDGQIVWDRTRRELDAQPTPRSARKARRRRQKKLKKKKRSEQGNECPIITSDDSRTVILNSEGNITINCKSGRTLVPPTSFSLCLSGHWIPSIPVCQSKSCRLPIRLHSFFVLLPLSSHSLTSSLSPLSTSEMLQSGDILHHGREARISCLRGFVLVGSHRVQCLNGVIQDDVGVCETRAPCVLPPVLSILFDPPRSLLEDEEKVNTQCGWITCKDGTLSPPTHCPFDLPPEPECPPNSPPFLLPWLNLTKLHHRCKQSIEGKTKRSRQSSIPSFKLCNAPPPFGRGLKVFNMENYVSNDQTAFPHDTVLQVGCAVSIPGRTYTEYRCVDGEWKHGEKISCAYGGSPCSFIPRSSLVTFDEDRQEIVHFNHMFNDGTKLRFRCSDIGRQKLKGRSESVCIDGVWNGIAPNCVDLDLKEGKKDSPAIHYEVLNGAYSVSPKGELVVDRSSSIVFSCIFSKSRGDPRWEFTSTYRTYPRRWTTINAYGKRDLEAFQLTVAVAQPLDSGVFHCITPEGARHGIKLRVMGVHCPPVFNSSTVFVHPSLPQVSSFFVGSYLQFSCPRGHSIEEGTTSAICLESGQWSRPVPTCQPISCPPLAVDHRRISSVSVSSYLFGGIAHFHCRPPLRLPSSTPPSIHCTSDGTWSSKIPDCINVQCLHVPMPNNGYQLGEYNASYAVGTVVHFGCLDRHAMEGVPSIECLPSGEWSELKTRCRALG